MTNNFLAFWPNHCIYIRAIFLLNLLNLSIKTVIVRIEENIIT